MSNQDTITKKKLSRIKIIINDDVQIIDYLADLWDREPVHALQRFVDYGNHKNCALLHNCRMDGQVVLILYMAPFGLNEGWNRLSLYAYNDLRGLCGYFQRWLNITNPFNKDVHQALTDITSLLFYQWAIENDNEDPAPVDSVG
jgi:hypothetical protein